MHRWFHLYMFCTGTDIIPRSPRRDHVPLYKFALITRFLLFVEETQIISYEVFLWNVITLCCLQFLNARPSMHYTASIGTVGILLSS